MAVQEVAVHDTPVAGFGPKVTPVVPPSPVPVIVTGVPPVLGPVDGLMPVTVGAVPLDGRMSGPVAPHCDTPMLTVSPRSRTPKILTCSAVTVMPVEPVTDCPLCALKVTDATPGMVTTPLA